MERREPRDFLGSRTGPYEVEEEEEEDAVVSESAAVDPLEEGNEEEEEDVEVAVAVEVAVEVAAVAVVDNEEVVVIPFSREDQSMERNTSSR